MSEQNQAVVDDQVDRLKGAEYIPSLKRQETSQGKNIVIILFGLVGLGTLAFWLFT